MRKTCSRRTSRLPSRPRRRADMANNRNRGRQGNNMPVVEAQAPPDPKVGEDILKRQMQLVKAGAAPNLEEGTLRYFDSLSEYRRYFDGIKEKQYEGWNQD